MSATPASPAEPPPLGRWAEWRITLHLTGMLLQTLGEIALIPFHFLVRAVLPRRARLSTWKILEEEAPERVAAR